MKSKNMKTTTVFTVLVLALAMIFGVVATPVSAFELAEKNGTEVNFSLNASEDLQAVLPAEILSLLNSLSFSVVQLHDGTGETPVDYFKLDVAGAEGVALSVGALTEAGTLLLDIPALFDGVLDVDVMSLMNEMLASEADGLTIPSLDGLTNFDMTGLMSTLEGVTGIIEQHMSDATVSAPELFTIDTLSAELSRSSYAFQDEQLIAMVNDIATYLETDESALEIFETVIVPLSEDEGVPSWSDMMTEIKENAAEGLKGITLTAEMLTDEFGDEHGFIMTITPDAGETEEDAGPVVISALALMTDTNLEMELRMVAPTDETIRFFLNAAPSEIDESISGSFNLKMHETSDTTSPAQEIILGEFANMLPVEFGPAGMMLLGNMRVVINYDEYQEPLTIMYDMTQAADGRLSGQVGLENMVSVMLDMAEIGEAEVVIPSDFMTKTRIPLKTSADLEALFTEDVAGKLMQVLTNLGIPLDAMMPQDVE